MSLWCSMAKIEVCLQNSHPNAKKIYLQRVTKQCALGSTGCSNNSPYYISQSVSCRWTDTAQGRVIQVLRENYLLYRFLDRLSTKTIINYNNNKTKTKTKTFGLHHWIKLIPKQTQLTRPQTSSYEKTVKRWG